MNDIHIIDTSHFHTNVTDEVLGCTNLFYLIIIGKSVPKFAAKKLYKELFRGIAFYVLIITHRE